MEIILASSGKRKNGNSVHNGKGNRRLVMTVIVVGKVVRKLHCRFRLKLFSYEN